MRSYYETNACYAGRHTGQRKVKDPDSTLKSLPSRLPTLHFYLLYGCSWTNFRTSHYRFLRSDRNFRTRCSSTGIQSESHNWITALFWIHTLRHRSWFWTDQYFRYRNSPGRHCYPKTLLCAPSTATPQQEVFVIPAHTLYGTYPPKIAEDEIKPTDETGEIVLSRVVVPEFIVCTWWFSAWLHRPKLLCKVQRLYQKM